MKLRPAKESDYPAICRIAAACFEDSIRPFYEQEGVLAFAGYIQPDSIRERRISEDALLVVAEHDGAVAGVAELREHCHISMLFVLPELQNCGIGHALLERIIKEARKRDAALAEVTVFSTPGAVPVYGHWGFRPTGAPEAVQGIRFVPMRLALQ